MRLTQRDADFISKSTVSYIRKTTWDLVLLEPASLLIDVAIARAEAEKGLADQRAAIVPAAAAYKAAAEAAAAVVVTGNAEARDLERLASRRTALEKIAEGKKEALKAAEAAVARVLSQAGGIFVHSDGSTKDNTHWYCVALTFRLPGQPLRTLMLPLLNSPDKTGEKQQILIRQALSGLVKAANLIIKEVRLNFICLQLNSYWNSSLPAVGMWKT